MDPSCAAIPYPAAIASVYNETKSVNKSDADILLSQKPHLVLEVVYQTLEHPDTDCSR
jgi:hypothetical protein